MVTDAFRLEVRGHPQVVRRRRGPPRRGPRRRRRVRARPAGRERRRQVDAGEDHRRRLPARRRQISVGGESHAELDPVTARAARRPDDLPGAGRRADADGGREHLARPLAGPRAASSRWRERAAARARACSSSSASSSTSTRRSASLRIGERQIVEIARALSDEARCLILDEPTAALSAQEIERLFGFVGACASRASRSIYITHRLDEVREIADRVVVLRDGDVVLEGEAAGARPRASSSRRWSAAPIGDVHRPEDVDRPPAPRRCWRSTRRRRSAAASRTSTLDVRAGEVVALYGKLGSGTARGRRGRVRPPPAERGDDRARRPRGARSATPADAIAAGVGLLPADRQREGAFMVRPVAENLAAPSWPRLARCAACITRGREARAYRRWHDELDDPLAQRPRRRCWGRCRAATSRRCCSAAGWSATRACSC